MNDDETSASLENTLDAFIAIDQHGKIVDWNTAAEEIFGYTKALVIGRQAAEIIAPQTKPEAHQAELAQTLRTGKGRLIGKRTEMTATRANGGDFAIEITLTRVSDQRPEVLTAYIRDITERRLTESILRKSEERFRMLVEGVSEYAIHLLDPRGRVLTWNSGVERIDGYRARDIVGRRFSCLYTPEDIARGTPEHALTTAGTEGRYSHEGWSVRKDGSRYWANVLLTSLRYENGTLFGFSRIGCDHTALKETQMEAERLKDALTKDLRERTDELQAAIKLLREVQSR